MNAALIAQLLVRDEDRDRQHYKAFFRYTKKTFQFL